MARFSDWLGYPSALVPECPSDWVPQVLECLSALSARVPSKSPPRTQRNFYQTFLWNSFEANNHKDLANPMTYFIFCSRVIFRHRGKYKIFLYINNTLLWDFQTVSFFEAYDIRGYFPMFLRWRKLCRTFQINFFIKMVFS